MRINHPNPIPGEVIANGLKFVDGVAETDADLSDVRPILEEHGFRFEDVADPEQQPGSGNDDGSSEDPTEVVAEPVTTEEANDPNAAQGAVELADGTVVTGEIPASAAIEAPEDRSRSVFGRRRDRS